MILRIGLAALLSAVVLMLWGYVFWVVLGVPQAVLHPIPTGDPLATAIKANSLPTGVYIWPGPAGGDVEQYRRGPLVQMFYAREGVDPMSTTVYARGLLHFFACGLLAGGLLAMVGRSLKGYWQRVGFVVLLGVFATVLVNLSPPIWFHHPWAYHLVLGGVDCVNALLMGIVLAAIVKPGPGPYWSLDGK